MLYYFIIALVTFVIFGLVAILYDGEEERNVPTGAMPLVTLLCGLLWPLAWAAVVFLAWHDRGEETNEQES